MSLNEDYYERSRHFDWDAHYDPPEEEEEELEVEVELEPPDLELPPTETYDNDFYEGEEDLNASN